MHILMVVIGGLVGLAAFYFGYRMFGRGGAAGAALFIWVWLAASILNGAVGVLSAGIPVINEEDKAESSTATLARATLASGPKSQSTARRRRILELGVPWMLLSQRRSRF